MKYIRNFAILIGLFGIVLSSAAVYDTPVAADAKDQIMSGAKKSGQSGGKSLTDQIKVITNILLFIIGAIAVIMIIYGGIRYVISGGDSSQVTGAKNTIIYAVVGLIVAILAYAIVNFVVSGLMS